MGDESPHLDLEHLTERMAEQIIFSIGAAPSDPKALVIGLLRKYLVAVEEYQYTEAMREQLQEERSQQN